MEALATSGGPHPAAMWAATTAGQIIQVAPDAGAEAHALRSRLLAVLEGWHDQVQRAERAKLERHGDERLAQPLDPTEHLDGAVAAVLEAASHSGTFKQHFEQPHVREYVRNVLGQHFATSMDIERRWHAIRRQRQ